MAILTVNVSVVEKSENCFLIGHSYLFDNRKSQHRKLTLCMLNYLACFLSSSSSPCPIKTTAQWHKRQSSGILMPGYGLFTDSPPRLLEEGLDLVGAKSISFKDRT